MVKKMRQWFLPGPMEKEPDYLPPGPRAEPREGAALDDWVQAEAGCAARLARVAGRIGRWMIDYGVARRAGGTGSRASRRQTSAGSWVTVA